MCAGVDPLPPELDGELVSVLYESFWFIEAAIALPRYKTLLLADTGAAWGALLAVSTCVGLVRCVLRAGR